MFIVRALSLRMTGRRGRRILIAAIGLLLGDAAMAATRFAQDQETPRRVLNAESWSGQCPGPGKPKACTGYRVFSLEKNKAGVEKVKVCQWYHELSADTFKKICQTLP